MDSHAALKPRNSMALQVAGAARVLGASEKLGATGFGF
jgi:hypothetical protein